MTLSEEEQQGVLRKYDKKGTGMVNYRELCAAVDNGVCVYVCVCVCVCVWTETELFQTYPTLWRIVLYIFVSFRATSRSILKVFEGFVEYGIRGVSILPSELRSKCLVIALFRVRW